MRVVAAVTKPFVKLLSFSTNVVVRLFGMDPHADEENVTEEEIRMMVDVGCLLYTSGSLAGAPGAGEQVGVGQPSGAQLVPQGGGHLILSLIHI